MIDEDESGIISFSGRRIPSVESNRCFGPLLYADSLTVDVAYRRPCSSSNRIVLIWIHFGPELCNIGHVTIYQ